MENDERFSSQLAASDPNENCSQKRKLEKLDTFCTFGYPTFSVDRRLSVEKINGRAVVVRFCFFLKSSSRASISWDFL